jgi:hypothetical protein
MGFEHVWLDATETVAPSSPFGNNYLKELVKSTEGKPDNLEIEAIGTCLYIHLKQRSCPQNGFLL